MLVSEKTWLVVIERSLQFALWVGDMSQTNPRQVRRATERSLEEDSHDHQQWMPGETVKLSPIPSDPDPREKGLLLLSQR